jgi:hypothetical protein
MNSGGLDDDWLGARPGGGASRAIKQLQAELVPSAYATNSLVPEDKIPNIHIPHPDECHGMSDAGGLEECFVVEESHTQSLHAAFLKVQVVALREVGHKEPGTLRVHLRIVGPVHFVAEVRGLFHRHQAGRPEEFESNGPAVGDIRFSSHCHADASGLC